MNTLTDDEMVTSVLAPHFCAVQDVVAAHEVEPGFCLEKAKKVRFVIDPEIHDKPRHFAATRDDGVLMLFAPQIIDLPFDTLVAILAHEFGHALDFLYPGRWYSRSDGPGEAFWIAERDMDTKAFRSWRKVWETRRRDHVEWAADGIALSVTGKEITYSGNCLLQTFSGIGSDRPKGLR